MLFKQIKYKDLFQTFVIKYSCEIFEIKKNSCDVPIMLYFDKVFKSS